MPDTLDAELSPVPQPQQKRGFAAMDPQARRLIASLGGKAAHANGTAHEFTTAEAIAAGKKSQLNRRRSS